MFFGTRCRALESVSIHVASALSTALTIYPCQIRVHQRWQSNFLQLGRSCGGRPQRAVHPHAVTCQHCVIHTTLVGLEPATFRSLVRRATSSATEPTIVQELFKLIHSVAEFPQILARIFAEFSIISRIFAEFPKIPNFRCEFRIT